MISSYAGSDCLCLKQQNNIYRDKKIMDKLTDKIPQAALVEALIDFGGNEIVNLFHKRFYYAHEQTWRNTTWRNTQVFKCPFDLWVYQEIIYELKPDLIIECGTATGGSALYLADICELLGNGKIVTVDIDSSGDGYIKPEYSFRPKHPRIEYLIGSSTSTQTLDRIRNLSQFASKILVILDSNHACEHVFNELNLYKEFVTMGSYIIVEDSNRNGHPVEASRGAGPMEAIDKFLGENTSFVSDKTKEKYFLTFNPKGYLKKIG